MMVRRIAGTVGILVAFRVGTADAAPPRETWWVDARPEACAAKSATLTSEIRTACEATGQRAIAPSESAATRRATLVCERDEAWSLEARSGDGRFLWALPLDGEVPDRLRQGGVWAARSEVSAPPAVEPAAPARAADRGVQAEAAANPEHPESPFGITGALQGNALAMTGVPALFSLGVRGNAAIRLPLRHRSMNSSAISVNDTPVSGGLAKAQPVVVVASSDSRNAAIGLTCCAMTGCGSTAS